MLKDEEILQLVRNKVLMQEMTQHLKEETEKLKRDIERVKAKFPGLG